MADIFQINTLANACSYLTEAVGGNWTEQKVVSEAIKNNLRFCASIPEWVRPGIGELKIVGPDGFSYIDVLSDGLVGLEDFTLTTLMKHGRANLRTISSVTG